MDEPRYREYPIHPALAPFVKCIWSVESDRAIYDAPRERILPDSCVELVFHFNDPFLSHFSDGESAVQPRSFLVGQMKRFLEIAICEKFGWSMPGNGRNASRSPADGNSVSGLSKRRSLRRCIAMAIATK
jgi:Domain of unknown function (DUF6597)